MNDSADTAGLWSRIVAWLRGPKRASDGEAASVDITVGEAESLYEAPELLAAEEFLRANAHQLPPEQGAPLISLSATALKRMVLHAESDLEVEVGGICLGRVYQDSEQRLMISIDQAITSTEPGGFVHERASLTFTAEAWRAMMQEAEAKHPDLRLLGWYHTHPGLSVFLSGMDLFIHHHFFPQPWQIAVVLDPVHGSIGVFPRNSESGAVMNGQLLRWSWELALHAEAPLSREVAAAENEARHDA